MANGWLGPGERGEPGTDVSEWGQMMACPYCGQGGFRSEAELQAHIAKYHEPGQHIPTEGYEIIVPGALIRGADGNFYDYKEYLKYATTTGMEPPIPIHPAVAQQMIAEYEASAQPEAPELILTPIGETTIGGYVYLQYEDQYGEIHTDPKPIREADDTAGDRFVGVESIGGYDFPIYERPDGSRFVGEDAYGRTPETAGEADEMTEWQQWQTEYLPWELEQEQELERWRLEQQFGQGQQDYELNKWRLEEQFNLAQQELDADLAYQEWQMGYIPHEAQQEYELNRWKLEQEFELQRQNLELSQAQLQQEQANYLADLSAHPRSWLEYSMAAGQVPLVQPWMMPLSSQEYPELEGLQAGQPIPGWPTDWSGAESYAPSVYSPVDMGTTPITSAPEYTPFVPPEYTRTQLQQAPSLPVTPRPPPVRNGHGTGGILPPFDLSHLTGQTIPPTAMADPFATLYPWLGQPELQPATLASGYGKLPPEEQPQVLGGSAYRSGLAGRINFARRTMGLSDVPEFIPGSQQMPEQTTAMRDWLNANPQVMQDYETYYSLPHEERAAWQETYNIPSMDYGGWVTEPTTVRLAGKEPELVTPLSQMWDRKPLTSEGVVSEGKRGRLATELQAERGRTPTAFQPQGYGTPQQNQIQETANRVSDDVLARMGITREQLMAQLALYPLERVPGYLEAVTAGGYVSPFPLTPSPSYTPRQGTYRGQYREGTTTPTAPTTSTPPATTPSTGGGYPGINDPYYPLGGLPNLTRPSRQYQARMGPTAWNQYLAYMQATSGIRPEEMEFRLWSMAPPSGIHRGLSYAR